MFQKWANVPQMIEEAEGDEIMQTRALKWLFFPPQILLTLRRTIRREIKVERRFNSLLVNQNGGL